MEPHDPKSGEPLGHLNASGILHLGNVRGKEIKEYAESQCPIQPVQQDSMIKALITCLRLTGYS